MKSYISNLEKNRWNVTQEHIVEIWKLLEIFEVVKDYNNKLFFFEKTYTIKIFNEY